MEKSNSKNLYKMGLMGFTLVTLASLMSIRGYPTLSLVKWEIIIFTLLAIVMYLIPAILTSSELATAWPKTGGVYVWIKEAFGQKWGFIGVWVQWFQMTIGFISILTAIAATFAYALSPELADNKIFEFAVIVIVWWVFTFINMRGLKTYTKLNSFFVAIGVVVPAIILIVFGLAYILGGNPVQFTLHPTFSDLMPDFRNIHNIVLLVTFIFTFIGIEMTAVHAKEIKNVQVNYPLGLLIVGVILAISCVICALIIGLLVPASQVNILAGVMQGFEVIFGSGWVVTIIALLITIGSIGQVSSWILGPVRGLLVTAQDGNLPKILQKENENGMPANMMILQAIIVTFWGAIFVLLPGGVNSSIWILYALTTLVYIIMYFLMYAALIKLRYSRSEVERPFKIPGGKLGVWVVGGWGFLAMVFLFIVALFPPSQINESGLTTPEYIGILLVGTLIIIAIPVIIHTLRRPSWKPENTDENSSN